MKKVIYCLLSLLLILPGNTVYAEISAKDFVFDREIGLKGVFSSDRFYFTPENYWNVKSAQLNLIFTQSSLVTSEESTLTVYLNGSPEYSTRLTGKDKYKEQLSINFHSDNMKSGLNEVKLQLYLRITSDKPCIDDVNAANWITFHKESFVRLNFDEKKPSTAIGDFPYPFIKSGSSTLITLPDNYTNNELKASLFLSSLIGSKIKNEDINLTLSRISEVSARESNHIIYIGSIDNTPRELLQLFTPAELSNANKSAVLKLSASPYNSSKRILCILSRPETESTCLDTAVRLLFNDNLVHQIRNNSYLLNTGLEVLAKPKNFTSELKFEDLGYDNIELKGPFRQQATVGIKLPKNRQFQPGAKINLNIRYSKNLNFNKSLATIYINGIPTGSKKLELNAADKDIFELAIPQDALKNAFYLDIRIAFDLEIEDLFCTQRQEDTPWAFISKDSNISFQTNEKEEFLFENFPSPFISDNSLNDLTVILPDSPSGRDLDTACNILAFMGKDLESNVGNITVPDISTSPDRYKNADLIIIGTPENSKLIKEINESLWFKYNSNYTAFLPNEKKQLIESYSSTLASLQLIPSPFNSNYNALVVTAPSAENLYRASRFLYDPKFSSKLYGDCSLIDTDDNIYNHYFRIYNTGAQKAINNAKASGTQAKVFVIFFTCMLIIVLLTLFLYIRGQRKKYRR